MKVWRRLDVRLFASYALVAMVVFGALAVTVRVVAPAKFDDDLKSATKSAASESESHNVFVDSLDTALWIALAASLGAAAIVSTLVARKIVRPVREVRDATRRLANGHYDERVAEPQELELAELARDVNRLAVELETTERRRARLVSEVAHEMRTPLTTIEGYVEGILDGVFEPTEEVLVAVGEEASRLRRLASDLAELSRSEEGATALHLRVVDLGALAATSAERLRPQFDEKGVTLTVRAGPPLPVDVDPDRIAQVLTNLFGNALTYTKSGGTVDVTATRDHDDGAIAVTDTGIGISPEDLELVFDRFYRVHGPTRPAGGSGIGLTIARGLAHAHHGNIEAASSGVGTGSVFTLTIPIARPDESGIEPPAELRADT
jgi:signal transduction histidine kinase